MPTLIAARAEIEQLVARCTPSVPADFVRHYLNAISDEVLAARRVSAVAALIARHSALAAARQGDAAGVCVMPPAPGELFATLQTVVPDMPFLVDSVSQRIRETGAGIDWSVHPILQGGRVQSR